MKRLHRERMLLASVLSIGLCGCEPLRADLADLISPPGDTQMAARIGDMANNGKLREAIDTGEKFLRKSTNENASVNAKLVELYLESGDSARALLHLEKSNGVLIERPGAAPGRLSKDSNAINTPDAPDTPFASAQAGPNGAEAVAGNAKASTKP